MKKITHKELQAVVKKSYEKKIPMFLWGAMGIGKSTIIKDMATSMDLGFIDVRISQIEPSDLRGLPKTDGEVTKWLVPNWLPKTGKGILFFDELNLAVPSIQASCYQLILDRRLGDYILPDGWVIISAGNRIEDKANVYEMPSPLANRFTHVELSSPSIEDWTDWATKGKALDSRIIAFLNFKPSRLFDFNSKNKDKAFGTPRSWAFCSELIEGEEYEGNHDFLDTLIASSVGEGTAIELSAFLKLQRKIKAEEILKDPSKLRDIKEVDLRYSLMSSISEYYRGHKSTETIELIIKTMKHLEPEFSILLLRLTKSVDKSSFEKQMVKAPSFKEWVKDYTRYLE